MAIAHIQSAINDSAALSYSIASEASFSCASGNTLVIGVSNYTSGRPLVSGIADSYGNTYTMCKNNTGGDASHGQEIWVATNITGGGANTVTVTFAAQATYRVLAVSEYSGLATSSVFDSSTTTVLTSDSSTAHTTNSVSSGADDALIYGLFIPWSDYGIISATAPNTLRATGAGLSVVADNIVSGAGSYSVTGNTSGYSNQYVQAALAASFKGASAVATLNQHSFRFFNDDGSESGSTAKGALNTNISLAANDIVRIRHLIDASSDPTGKQFQLEYRRKPSGGSFGPWGKVN